MLFFSGAYPLFFMKPNMFEIADTPTGRKEYERRDDLDVYVRVSSTSKTKPRLLCFPDSGLT